MKIFIKFFTVCFLFFSIRDLKSAKHPFYVGVAEVVVNTVDSTVKISLRLFTDDLQKSFLKNGEKFNPDTTSFNTKYVYDYLKKHFQLIVGNNVNKNSEYSVGLKLLGWERVEDATWFYLESKLNNFQSDKNYLKVYNSLLYDAAFEQVHIIHFIFNGKRVSHQLQKPERIWIPNIK